MGGRLDMHDDRITRLGDYAVLVVTLAGLVAFAAGLLPL